MSLSPQTRPNIANLEIYEGGRSPELVRHEFGITGQLVELGANERPFAPESAVIDAITDAAMRSHRYPDFTAKELRQTLAAHLACEEAPWGRHCDIDPDQIVVGCGSSSLIQQLFLCYVSPGEDILVPWPSYRPLLNYAQLCAGKVVRVPLVDESVNLDALIAAMTPRTKLVCLTNPNNPTSTAVDRNSLACFLERVPPEVVVLVDEAYIQYSFHDNYGSAVREVSRFGNLVVARTFSKAFGLAGFRIGFVVANTAIVAGLRRVGFAFPVGNCAQAAALATLQGSESVAGYVQAIVLERDRMSAILRGLGWTVANSKANFLWLPMREPGASTAIASTLETRGIVTRAFADGLRITVGSPAENAALLEQMKDLRPVSDSEGSPATPATREVLSKGAPSNE